MHVLAYLVGLTLGGALGCRKSLQDIRAGFNSQAVHQITPQRAGECEEVMVPTVAREYDHGGALTSCR